MMVMIMMRERKRRDSRSGQLNGVEVEDLLEPPRRQAISQRYTIPSVGAKSSHSPHLLVGLFWSGLAEVLGAVAPFSAKVSAWVR